MRPLRLKKPIRKSTTTNTKDLYKGFDQQEESSSSSGELKTCKNPRMPFVRSPYNTRQRSRFTDDTPGEAVIIGQVCLAELEPTSLEEAMRGNDSEKWLAAINEEIDSLEKNQTWVLVPRTEDKHVITSRWAFKKKYNANGEIEKYRARLVARGCRTSRLLHQS